LPIDGYMGWYEVSSLGQVRRIKAGPHTRFGHLLKLQVHKDGYLFVDLCKDGKQHHLLVSRLVCTAFHGKCPLGKNCNHIDGKKANNRADNLEWVTPSENCKHRHEVLGHSLEHLWAANPWKGVQGTKHPRAKNYVVTTPDGKEIKVCGLKKFCRDHNLNAGAMFQLVTGSGHSYQHKGYKCRYG